MRRRRFLGALVAAAASQTLAACGGAATPASGPRPATLLNASYSATESLYLAYDELFAAHWRQTTGQRVTVHDSHAGSGSQARAVLAGLPADVVTLGLASDIDRIASGGLIAADWRRRLPDGGVPFTSTISFLVRGGNPRGIHDWSDLARPGVAVVATGPETSGAARWSFLAAWGYALRQRGGDAAGARDLVRRIYGNAVVLGASTSHATATFVQDGIGDVLVGWESENALVDSLAPAGKYARITPSASIVCAPPVAVVDRYAAAHGTTAVAAAYLRYHYSEAAQEVAARHFYRPRSAAAAARYPGRFPALRLFDIASFGGWEQASGTFFASGGVFDQIYRPGE